jgi:hypothetical protein
MPVVSDMPRTDEKVIAAAIEAQKLIRPEWLDQIKRWAGQNLS